MINCNRPIVSEDAVTEVHHTVISGHMQTARGTARVLDIPKTTILKVLHSLLCMFPYRYQCVQMLQLEDPQLHIDFANEFLIRYDAGNNWPLHILRTDGTHFNLNGNMNTKNCMRWADTNIHAVAPVPLFDAKVTVWCGISGTILLGPYFFEEATLRGFVTCSVTSVVQTCEKNERTQTQTRS